MLKVMHHQLDSLNEQTKELSKEHTEYKQHLAEADREFKSRENELFRKFHEERIQRIKLQIEEGLYPYKEGEDILEKLDIDQATPEEIEAHAELKDYADAILKRQQKFQLPDASETVVENKMLINQIDQLLGNKPSADSGVKYSQLPNISSVPTLHYDASQSSITGSKVTGLNKAPSQSLFAEVDRSLDEYMINRLYAEV